jgi:hypothetical protein
VLSRDPAGLELRADPSALAPERLLVFEVEGPIQNFTAAVRRVQGLQIVDEEELEADDDTGARPVAYLLVPDARALAQLLSLWREGQAGRTLATGYTPWRDVFALLRDLRPWGPSDRVIEEDRVALAEDAAGLADADMVRVEIELVFRAETIASDQAESALLDAVRAAGGSVADRSRIGSIAYHAILAHLPAAAVRSIVALVPSSIAGLDPVMHIRPQAVSFSIETADPTPSLAAPPSLPDGSPIAALLDGVPVSQHPLLAGRLRVEDVFNLEEGVQVRDRRHGTAMASLLVHGDRNRNEPPLGRTVAVVPVMVWDGNGEALPEDRLVVDVIHRAIGALRAQPDPLAPDVLIVNLSLGNLRRPFHGQMSPWARLLDRLAWEYGILFVVSAGNAGERFPIEGFQNSIDFGAAAPSDRSAATLLAMHSLAPDRRLISPAETINGLTVGASNEDAVDASGRRAAAINVDPYPDLRMANPSSRLGPGFAGAVKPDTLMPGGREHVRPGISGGRLEVQPAGASRAFGLKVAAPDGSQATEHFTGGTSGAAALASRTCHLIHDALEQAYGQPFLDFPHAQRALILKALFAHGARWPDATADLIRATLGPHGRGQAPKQKDNVRRFCGYGVVDPSEVVACAADRVTFWATGSIGPEEAVRIDVPVPNCMGGKAQPHELAATLAWFTPILPGRQSYRTVRLSLLDPQEIADLQVGSAQGQPDANQAKRGTLLSRRWSGSRAPVVHNGMFVSLTVQRDPDQGEAIDDPIPFALAATLAMPAVVELYDEVRARLGIVQPVRPRAR